MALKKRRWILGSGCLFDHWGINGEVRLELGGACVGGRGFCQTRGGVNGDLWVLRCEKPQRKVCEGWRVRKSGDDTRPPPPTWNALPRQKQINRFCFVFFYRPKGGASPAHYCHLIAVCLAKYWRVGRRQWVMINFWCPGHVFCPAPFPMMVARPLFGPGPQQHKSFKTFMLLRSKIPI